MDYPTSTGRSIAEIAAHATKYAAGRDDESAASAVISVALTQVVGPMDDAYDPTRHLTKGLMRGNLIGSDSARWSLDNFGQFHTDAERAKHSARLRAVANVIETSEVRLESLYRAVRELRDYADVYSERADVRADHTRNGAPPHGNANPHGHLAE